jgi:uncharacterized Zn finger protein
VSYWGWKPYVPVAKRRQQAEKAIAKAQKVGKGLVPVRLSGRAIATSFWGKAWCDNLEAYSDFSNRLPRGRTYVRNGSVIDLKVEPGKVKAQVVGSSLYRVEISVSEVPKARWQAIAKESAGSIDSMIELLQGKLSRGVMDRLCRPQTGLFPAPNELKLDCSCPDWATMCKHVAAVLYGVGARLDAQPELLFTLRKVDASALVAQAMATPMKTGKTPARERILADDALADVFGIDFGAAEVSAAAPPAIATTRTPSPRKKKTMMTKLPLSRNKSAPKASSSRAVRKSGGAKSRTASAKPKARRRQIPAQLSSKP